MDQSTDDAAVPVLKRKRRSGKLPPLKAALRELQFVFCSDPLCTTDSSRKETKDGKDGKESKDSDNSSESAADPDFTGYLDPRLLHDLAVLPSCLLDVILARQAQRGKFITSFGRNNWDRLLDCLEVVRNSRQINNHAHGCACNIVHSPLLKFEAVCEDLVQQGYAMCVLFDCMVCPQFLHSVSSNWVLHNGRSQSGTLLAMRWSFLPYAYELGRCCEQ